MQRKKLMILTLTAIVLISIGVLAVRVVFRTPEIHEPKTIPIRVLRWVGNQPVVRMESPCFNQNALGFTFKGGQLDMYLDTVYLGHAVVDTSFDVAAHAAFTVPIQMQLDAVRLGTAGVDLSREVHVRVEGAMRGSAFGITRSLPIRYEGVHFIKLIMNYQVNGQ